MQKPQWASQNEGCQFSSKLENIRVCVCVFLYSAMQSLWTPVESSLYFFLLIFRHLSMKTVGLSALNVTYALYKRRFTVSGIEAAAGK